MSSPANNTTTEIFKSFPEFSKLTMADRKIYRRAIEEFLPIADISFPVLMTWWNWLDSCAVSVLNENLVISYWMPGEDKYSGMSLLGVNDVDESICTIFDYLRSKNDPVRLVHVPEFVVENIRYHELYRAKEERNFDEYIYPVSKFYPLESMSLLRRSRMKKRILSTNYEQVELKEIDLSKESNKALLLNAAEKWKKKGFIRHNNIAKNEEEATQNGIIFAKQLGISNLCLFIDGELRGFSLHEMKKREGYVIALYVRIDPGLQDAFEYMLYLFAKWLTEQGISYINMKYDLGILSLRMHKITLGPSSYFRKYTIEPSS